MRRLLRIPLLVVSLAFVAVWGISRLDRVRASDKPGPGEKSSSGTANSRPTERPKSWATAREPKPLSKSVKKGLDWLVEHQLPGGGWGQGEESAHMRGNRDVPEPLRDTPNVADTCIATLALLRSGSTPHEGPYKDAIVKGVRFVRSQVEESDSGSLSVSPVKGTRVQQKLGPNIDTFLASMLLAEVKGRMPDDASEKGVDVALNKVVGKIERHQKQDGSFEGAGWAPILAQAMCGKGINRASQAGAQVSETTLARAENGAKMAFYAASPISSDSAAAPAAGRIGAAAYSADRLASAKVATDSAGVELYSRAASLGVLQDSANTNQGLVDGLREKLAKSKDQKERSDAERKLGEIADAEKVRSEAQAAVVDRLNDKQFVAGFGSNGGEEFLSYMNIAESLVVKGGDEWKQWDSKMTENLNRVQNDDGSWSGHHCITGRTFCTSTALLVLMADRTPVPVVAK
jgi:hypothetical protein